MGYLPSRGTKEPVIGVDLDNTVINYDKVLFKLARQKGYIDQETMTKDASKQLIRDRIRHISGGDLEWQKIQALIYTTFLQDAEFFPGVEDFFKLARQRNLKIYIVSHKTKYASQDQTQTSLREAATLWLKNNGFFHSDGLGLLPEQVFFESTRQDKIGRIIALNCTHFIDDLIEFFAEEAFPSFVDKILFKPHNKESTTGHPVNEMKIFSSWKEITDYFFFPPR